MCNGQSSILTVTGASSYTWSTGATTPSISVSPTINTSYSITVVTGTCNLPFGIYIIANPNPSITVVSNASVLCTGQTATLSSSGANSYTWSTSASGSITVVSPTITTNYTVSGTDANGCVGNIVFTQSVSTCASINEIANEYFIFISPNPNNGDVVIYISLPDKNMELEVFNALGKLIKLEPLTSGSNYVSLKNESDGMYFITIKENSQLIYTAKIIKQQ